MKWGLAFSGGKDSWACLMLFRHKLDEITVFWVNTGKNYPELLESIEKAREMCPNFVEIEQDRESQNNQYGIPSEMVPINWTYNGQLVTGKKETMVQSYLDCCYANIAEPLHKAIAEHGITHLIAGQRDDEAYKAPIRSGDVLFGVVRVHPIEHWTRDEVLGYLKHEIGELPEHFYLNHSSMDCYDCTAYKEADDRHEFTKRHPSLLSAFEARKSKLNAVLKEASYG